MPKLLGCHSRDVPAERSGHRLIGVSGIAIGLSDDRGIESVDLGSVIRPGTDNSLRVDRQSAEYSILRDTIRQRGTVRMALIPVIFIGWAAAAIATAAVITVAISTLVPLMVLVAGFETVFALHINVERIGRYLQVFHEPDRGWEQVAATFGQRFGGAGAPDPLFAQVFVFAISLNFLPVILGGEMPEVVVLAVLHLLAVFRIRMARAAARRQRAEDIQRFQTIHDQAD